MGAPLQGVRLKYPGIMEPAIALRNNGHDVVIGCSSSSAGVRGVEGGWTSLSTSFIGWRISSLRPSRKVSWKIIALAPSASAW